MIQVGQKYLCTNGSYDIINTIDHKSKKVYVDHYKKDGTKFSDKEELNLDTYLLEIKQGTYTLVGLNITATNPKHNLGCHHDWQELVLFSSSIIYCPKCNAEKKEY